ncbi:MAG: hypothetical protein UIH18_06305 [Fibrobacteraceae bacterium]|nr:hypothetical protein [Fibrobacteraceae bacterium]
MGKLTVCLCLVSNGLIASVSNATEMPLERKSSVFSIWQVKVKII